MEASDIRELRTILQRGLRTVSHACRYYGRWDSFATIEGGEDLFRDAVRFAVELGMGDKVEPLLCLVRPHPDVTAALPGAMSLVEILLIKADTVLGEAEGGKASGGTPTVEQSFLTSELCQMLDITNPTLNGYAKKAGVETPGVGGRDFRYSQADLEAICRYILAEVTELKIRSKAQKIITEIKSKSNRNRYIKT